MTDASILVIILATFCLAGWVKGIIGMGLPTVSLIVLTAALDLPSAMALLLGPSLATNIWQAVDGQHSIVLLKRLRGFLFSATLFIGVGSLALTRVDLPKLSLLLGLLLGCYALLNLLGFRMTTKPASEKWLGLLAGSLNGVFTGMTGSFVFPGVLYLQSLDMPREQFIKAMGMLFTLSTVILAVALFLQGLFPKQLMLQSGAGIIPALVGMVLGKKVRVKLSEATFKQVFFMSVLVVSIFIVMKSL